MHLIQGIYEDYQNYRIFEKRIIFFIYVNSVQQLLERLIAIGMVLQQDVVA